MARSKDVTRAPKFDPSIPRVTVELAGEQFDLCFDLRSMATAKARLRALNPPVEINILQALDFRALDVDVVPAFFYAATQRYHPDLTWAKVLELVNIRTVSGIYAALAEAYVAAVKGGGAPNPPKADQAQS